MRIKEIQTGIVYASKRADEADDSDVVMIPVVVLSVDALYCRWSPRSGDRSVTPPLRKGRDLRYHAAHDSYSATGLLTLGLPYWQQYLSTANGGQSQGVAHELLLAAGKVDVAALVRGDFSSIPDQYRLNFFNPSNIYLPWEEWLREKAELDRISQESRVRQEALLAMDEKTLDRMVRLAGELGFNIDRHTRLTPMIMVSVLERLAAAERLGS